MTTTHESMTTADDIKPSTVNVNFKIDTGLKQEAEEVLREMGLNMTNALTIYLKKVVSERRIPFEITADPFYHPANIAHLARLKAQLDQDHLPLAQHTLLED